MAVGQSVPTAESGVFLLHKFAKQIGKESYTVSTDAAGTHLSSEFLFTDRGTPVPMKTAFEAGDGLVPVSLTEKGSYSRHSEADDSFTVKDGTLSITRNGKTTTQAVPKKFFLVDGYSPVAMQQEMMRFWLGHGSPASLAISHGNTEDCGERAVDGSYRREGGAACRVYGFGADMGC